MRPFSNLSSPKLRAMALFVAFGALVILLLATVMTTQAYVTKITETTLDHFVSGEFRRTGLLDIPAQEIDSVQLIPIGLVGTWYEDAQSLPIALTEHSAVGVGGHLIVMGGSNDISPAYDTVYVSSIGDGGALNPWVEQTSNPLPVPLSGAAAVVVPVDVDESLIYVIGGIDGFSALDSVYYTTFHHNTGTIDPWTANPNPLPEPTYYLAAAIHRDYVYVVGGKRDVVFPFSPYTADVFYAQVQPDGSLGAWQTAESLPDGRANLLVVAYEGATDTLHAIGGRAGATDGNQDDFFADINSSDGSLTPWQTSQGNLILPYYAQSGALVSDQIVMTGGVARTVQNENIITGTVQAALVDPDNAGYRLYDWCEGDTQCTIGAWLTGKQLPSIRAFHQTVQESFYVYTIGGVEEGDPAPEPTTSVYRGSMTDGAQARYAPSGYYVSSDLDFGTPADLRQIEWDITLAHPLSQTLDLSYQYKPQGGDWQAWSAPQSSVDGNNPLPIIPAVEDIVQFRYRITMTTDYSTSSPLFNQIDVFYELDDADLEVIKHTGSVISASLGSNLDYTIVFTNNGQWVAENVFITETLPDHTTFGGNLTTIWHQVGASNQYTASVGDLASGARGEADFRVHINSGSPPPGVKRITNTVDINYPTMTDELGEPSFDPNMDDNHFEFSNPLLLYNIDLIKESDPPSESYVIPTQRVTYTITYSNAGDLDLTGVVITDQVSADTTYVPGSIWPPGGDDSALPELRWTIGDLASGVSGTVGFVVTVDDVVSGTVFHNEAFARTDQLPVESCEEPTTHTVQIPDLTLIKDSVPVSNTNVAPNDQINYTITFSNNSQFMVPGAVVTDSVPISVTYVPGSIFGPGADATGEPILKWNVGNLAPHDHVTLGFAAIAKEFSQDTLVVNQAQGNSLPTKLQESNLVTHTIRPLDLIVWKEATPPDGSDVASDQQIDYTIHYLNNSDGDMSNVQLTDPLPAEVTYVASSITGPGANDSDPTELKWSVGAVLSGEGGTAGFSVTVNDVVSGTVIENIAEGDSDQSDPTTSLTVTHTVKDVVPGLTKSATPASGSIVQAGDQINYTLSYLNESGQTMNGFELTDVLPGIVDYVPGSIWPSTGDDSDPSELNWTIGDVASGGGGSVGFAVQVSDTVGGGLEIVNSFTGTATGMAPSASNKVTHVTTATLGTDFIIVDFVFDPEVPKAGESFDLHVTVRNDGNLDADDGEFWVEAYVRPMPAMPPYGPADHYQGYCQDSGCATLRAEYVEWRPDLNADDEFPFLFRDLSRPDGQGYLVCAQVDICFEGFHCNDPAWGWYPERDEANNVVCELIPPDGGVFIPLIYKNY